LALLPWFAVAYVMYYLFHTVYIIPHYGLGPELTLDYNERSVLFGIREGYTTFAIIFGALLTILYLNLVVRVKV
jgi:GPH family glycoside/pentoside/hexuronide:cation symporter